MIRYINLPYVVLNFKAHKKLKNKILGAIEQIAPNTISALDHQIYKTDWNQSTTIPRPYVEIIHSDISSELDNVFKNFGFDRYNVHNIWFQQYQLNDIHGWHTHANCHYTCIYYVELPNGAPSTQFLDPLDNETIFKINVNEGDILIMPSMIKHRSPSIENNVRKTIISFNASVICDNAQ
jgi:cupin superfamily acireductone dioxygenase involved in methionine salvage